MSYHIITDSATDLPQEVIDRYHLRVIPTPVVINETTYLDGETIHTGEFYQLLDQPENDIKTFHINPHMFQEVFLEYAARGEEVIYLCFSTGIAGTFNAAGIAKEEVLEKYPDFHLTIIDSKCASIGFGLMVYRLLVMQENGASADLIREAALFYREHIRHIFTVRTLEYLIRGGRLGKMKGMLAETLSIKPVITLDDEGRLEIYKLVRGRKASLKEMVKYVQEHGVELEQQTLGFSHGEDHEDMERLKGYINEAFTPKDSLTGTVGCAIGAHTGRGIIAVCFLDASEARYREYLQ